MCRILLFFLVLAFCCPAFGEITSSSAQFPDVLRIAYPNFPPFHWEDETGRIRGMFYEIVTEALEKRMHQHLHWTAYPWARCQELLKDGQEDAIITVPTKERNTYTWTHDHPFFYKPLHLFTSAGHPRFSEINRIRTLADIKDLGLSVITYSENGWHFSHIKSLGIKSYESASLHNVWVMLAAHRGDLVIEWPRGARPDLRRLGLQNVVVDTGIEVAQMPFYLLIRQGSPQVRHLGQFDRTIQSMVADGTIATILQRYE
ncbi:MAG: substrate-binding periplasmic protein [Desulfobulbus sp.]